MGEAEVIFYKTNKSRLRWWIYVIIAAAVLLVGYKSLELITRSNDKAAVVPVPGVEIAASNNATAAIKKRVEEAQKVRAKLPEVVKNAKDMARIDVNGLNDNNIADRWNGLLGRYREDRAAAEGVSAPD